jgi:hypothetical protein
VVSTSNVQSDVSRVHPQRESAEESGSATPKSVALSMELDLEDAREESRRLLAALKQLREENLELNRAINQSAMPDELHRFHVLVEDQSKQLELMRASLSWRITAPLRLLARMLGAR